MKTTFRCRRRAVRQIGSSCGNFPRKAFGDTVDEMVMPVYMQFKSWAEEFDSATLEQKKMIACQLRKCIEVVRGYKVSVELDMTYRQFCTEWSAKGFLETFPAI